MARPLAEARHPRRPGRASSPQSGRRRLLALVLGGSSLAALAGWLALPAISALPERSPSPSLAPSGGVSATDAPPPRTSLSPTAVGMTLPSASPRVLPTAEASSAVPQPTHHPQAAPTSADDFAVDGQVVLMGFPLREDTRYRYRDNWGDLREGHAEGYNHAHSRRRGELLRAHDGIDIYAQQGEPVVSPFDGLAIDPRTRWQPWIRERYGRTAVLVSEEPSSAGYVALLSHLDQLWLEPGQRVRRGEVIGTVGNTGNAEGGPAHVHFELRAPFPLSWVEVGEQRLVDAFNPYPSLVAADPKRSD